MATKTYYATKDAFMGDQLSGGSFQGWNGKDDHLPVGVSGSGSYRWRSCVYFSISFSELDNITDARLYLYSHVTGSNIHSAQSSSPSEIWAYRITSDWGEGADPGEGNLSSNETWDWNNRHDSVTFSNSTSHTCSQTGDTNGDEEAWNVTAIVQDWKNGSNNYGIQLRNDNETSASKGVQFFSRSNGSDGRRPKLIITYDPNVAPNAPVSLTPTGGTIVNTLFPTFNFTRSDPDSGDYMTQCQVIVYRSDGTTVAWDSSIIAVNNSTSFSVNYGFINAGETLIGNSTYYWKVRSRDKGSLWGPYSAQQQFKVNSLPTAPVVAILYTPTTDLNDSTPSFSIQHHDPDPGDSLMYGYQVQVTNTATSLVGFDSGNVDTSGAPVASVVVTSSALSFGTAYTMKARTKDSNGAWGPFSSNLAFTTHTALPPINMDPSASEAVTATPTLTASAPTTGDTIIAYTIRVYTDDLSSTPLPATRYTTGIVGGGSGFSKLYAGSALTPSAFYKWQAFIETSTGANSAYSALQRFQVVDATTPTLTAPSGDNAYTITPVFTGQRATTFNRFQYELYPSTSTTTSLGTVIYASGTLSATITGAGPFVFTSTYGGAPAIVYATTYKWRARVSADAGANWSSWSGLNAFSTASASTGTPNFPAANEWISTATPGFKIDRGGADTIDKFQVRVYTNSSVLLWDSGLVDVTNGTAAVGPVTYAGPVLSGGLYKWEARYQNTVGPVGPYFPLSTFRVNSAPNIPSDLYPTPDVTFRDTLLPNFTATFSDADTAATGDAPTAWDIVILSAAGAVLTTKTISAGLITGQNAYTWTGGDLALSYSTTYKWKTRFKDTKAVYGAYSAESNFILGQSPNGTITVPSDGSTVSSANPTVSWSYTGGTQAKFKILVNEVDAAGNFISKRTETTPPVVSAATSYALSGLQNNKYYTIRLTVTNTDLLDDPTPSQVQVQTAFAAPDPIAGLVPTSYEDKSLVHLDWDTASLKSGSHQFVAYYIYRRLIGDVEWELVGQDSGNISDSFYDDWYVGHNINYEYRVTQIQTKTGVGIELESPDASDGSNIVPVTLASDVWMFIGYDRSDTHILELPVNDEDHERPVQQEAFEPLGSDRKVIMRGFVLGHEGSVECTWMNVQAQSPQDEQVYYNETIIGRRIVDYLTRTKGPHILKSPFGDVWDCEFQGPTYKWLPAGHLQVSLSWVETGQTSQVAF